MCSVPDIQRLRESQVPFHNLLPGARAGPSLTDGIFLGTSVVWLRNLRMHKYSDTKYKMFSLLAQLVKNLPAVQETQVLFLGPEDPPEIEMAIHSSILAWKIWWTEEPGGLHTFHGVTRVRHE